MKRTKTTRCLICGARRKWIFNHVNYIHHLSITQYKRKFNLYSPHQCPICQTWHSRLNKNRQAIGVIYCSPKCARKANDLALQRHANKLMAQSGFNTRQKAEQCLALKKVQASLPAHQRKNYALVLKKFNQNYTYNLKNVKKVENYLDHDNVIKKQKAEKARQQRICLNFVKKLNAHLEMKPNVKKADLMKKIILSKVINKMTIRELAIIYNYSHQNIQLLYRKGVKIYKLERLLPLNIHFTQIKKKYYLKYL